MSLDWGAYPSLSRLGPIPATCYRASTRDKDGNEIQWLVQREFARSRTGRRLKRTWWRLYRGNRPLGRPFYSAWLAKAWAAEYDARSRIEDMRERRKGLRDLIENGGAWCAEKERERRMKQLRSGR